MELSDISKQQVISPSIGAIAYQALTLKDVLLRFTKEEYPVQACQVRDVLLCLVDRICEQLHSLLEIEANSPDKVDSDRALKLASHVYEIYSYVRYLRASSPQQTPPGIQLALAELTDIFFPKANGKPVCLVRPQWSYNLGYVDLSAALDDMIKLDVFNPKNDPEVTEKEDLLPALWKKQKKIEAVNINPATATSQDFPNQLAILSFAGLDTNDVLLYPILAHELGHFIDYSFRPDYLNINPKLYRNITVKAVEATLDSLDCPESPAEVLAQVSVCFREIIADLLGVRMMGLSFFVAQAEYLKTLSAWPGSVIEPSGYPGIRFRLSIVFDHFRSFPDNANAYNFLKNIVKRMLPMLPMLLF
jgi:hypothetical protein